MKKISVFSFTVLLCAFLSVSSFAQIATTIPHTISYQGFVTDAVQKPLSGTHSITVKFYDAPIEGNLLHSENFSSRIDNGIFSVLLGSQQAFGPTLDFRVGYWIGITIDNNSELTPRTALSSVPYALHAESASALSKDAKGAITSLNGRTGDLVLQGGPGTEIITDGKTITITAIPSSPMVAQGNGNVGSIIGTANQVLANGTSGAANAQTGNVTLTTPQDIHSGASPTFSGLTLSGMGVGIVHSSASGLHSSSLITNTDVSSTAAITYGKLALAGNIVNNDISNAAAIAYSKLALAGNVVNNDISNSAAIADLKLATIATVGKVANSATTATSLNTPNTIVLRDLSGNFTAGTITANALTISGKASSAATLSTDPTTCLATKGYVDNAVTSVWSTNGNSGLTSANYLGTSDATDLSLSTSGTERMRITADGSLLLAGQVGAIPASGRGTRMMWIPSLGAFRAGKANGSEWNSGSIGAQSVAMGYGVLASGAQSVALGFFTSAYGMGSTAIGTGCSAFVDGSTAMGSACQADGYNSVAMGDNATVLGDGSVALGSNTNANALYTTAMGSNTTASANYGTVMGRNITVGLSSFGFNGATTSTVINVSGMNNVAYFGDVDMMIGNDDNNARSLRFYGKNSSSTLSGAHYTAFKAGVQTVNLTYTLPTSQGSSGSYLTNNGSGTLSWATQNSAYGSLSAGAQINIPANTNVVKIEDDADNTQVNLLVLPSGTNGQIMYIFNNDAQATTGDAIIASGATATLIYADGWRRTN